MVRRTPLTFCGLMLLLSGSLLGMSVALADVTASIDRPSVDLNESFELKISTDARTDAEPDFSALDLNFYRGQASERTFTSMMNGDIRRSRSWTISLMAKSTGTHKIPAVTVGSERSQPLSIVVNEPTNAPPGEADVFVTSEVDQTEAYVQSQILYRVKIYRAVSTRQNALRDPTITGAESLIELVGDEQSYEAILSGTAYDVVERAFAIYPQESGEISISPANFEARVLRDGRITGRKVFRSDAHTISVLPKPAAPVDYPDAAWLPARDLILSEEWSRDPDRLEAGEPLTRHVTISALGQLETQIPALALPVIDGMNVYADKPDLSRRIEPKGIRGIRKDQYALIGVNGGAVEIPELIVPWWDIDAGEWRFARLESRTIDINAQEEIVAGGPAGDPDLATDASRPAVGESSILRAPDQFWQKVSQLLAGIWLLTVAAWWWSSRENKRDALVATPAPIYKRQAKFLKAARKAANSSDAAGARSAIIQWGRLQWPDDAPRSVGELAERVTAPLSDELVSLSAASYGEAESGWDGQALSKALRSINILAAEESSPAADLLPPLAPPGI